MQQNEQAPLALADDDKKPEFDLSYADKKEAVKGGVLALALVAAYGPRRRAARITS